MLNPIPVHFLNKYTTQEEINYLNEQISAVLLVFINAVPGIEPARKSVIFNDE